MVRLSGNVDRKVGVRMKKNPLKSKTILFAAITIIVAILNLFGITGGDEIDSETTFKEFQEQQSSRSEGILNALVLLGGAGAVYGRVVAKDEIGGAG